MLNSFERDRSLPNHGGIDRKSRPIHSGLSNIHAWMPGSIKTIRSRRIDLHSSLRTALGEIDLSSARDFRLRRHRSAEQLHQRAILLKTKTKIRCIPFENNNHNNANVSVVRTRCVPCRREGKNRVKNRATRSRARATRN